MDLEAESRVVAERVDQFLAERPELREAVDRLPYTAEQPAGRSAAIDEPPTELPSSAAVLQDLEEYLKSLRRENGGAASDTESQPSAGLHSLGRGHDLHQMAVGVGEVEAAAAAAGVDFAIRRAHWAGCRSARLRP